MRFRPTILPAAIAALAACGCASPGPPRPPSLRLPEPAVNLHAVRTGDTVVLDFSVSGRTTDGAATDDIFAGVCRSVDDSTCLPLPAYATAPAVAPGPHTVTDTLPAALTTGAPHLLAYQVTLYNARHRTAGLSEKAFAVAGDAPAAVASLRAESRRGGIVLRWQPEATPTGAVVVDRLGPPAPRKSSRESTTAGIAARASAPPSNAPVHTTLRAPAVPGAGAFDTGGLVDTTAVGDVPYTYTAVRVRPVTVGGQTLEVRSAASAPLHFTLRDTFPPATPTGLLAAAFPVEGTSAASPSAATVDLIWQPNREPDLAGYTVFRQPLDDNGVATAAPELLTPQPVPQPSFHDRTAAHGARLRYTVAAVDTHGNTSAPSEAADVHVP
jgi:hypothetical protein